MKKLNLPLLAVSLGLPLLAGGVGSAFTVQAIPTWYAGLNKPFFNPPNWIFGPVWTLLYILMGIAFYLVLTTKTAKRLRQTAIIYFVIQMALNAGWSIVFFSWQQPLVALVVVVGLWLSIVACIISFQKINILAARLLYPYLAWVTFASLLNMAIVLLN